MGHLGLTPQSIYKFGTYNVRAKDEAEAEKLKQDARLLEEAGCFGLVLDTPTIGPTAVVPKPVPVPEPGLEPKPVVVPEPGLVPKPLLVPVTPPESPGLVPGLVEP